MKSGLSSRTNVLHLGGALAGIVFAVAAAIAPGKVSAELAEAVAALLLLVFAGAGGYLKADDRKKVGTLKEAIVREIANAKVTVGPPVEGEEMPIPHKPTAGELLDAKAAKAAAKVGVGLLMALAFAGCDRSAEADAAFATEGRCGETVIRTVRKGVPVQCTIYGCRFPTRMSTLFCDEVPK